MAFRIARDCPLTHSSVTRPVRMTKLTQQLELTPYLWVHPPCQERRFPLRHLLTVSRHDPL
jgi:hypothetical protein